MNAVSYSEIAAVALAEVRAIYPNGRRPDPAITEAWARTIERSRRVWPAAVWREAVTAWAVSNSEPPTPADLIAAAGQVVSRWEADPATKARLNDFRRDRLRSAFGDSWGADFYGQGAATSTDEIEAPRPAGEPSGRELAEDYRQRLRSRRLRLVGSPRFAEDYLGDPDDDGIDDGSEGTA